MDKIILLLVAALVSGCATSHPQKLWDATAMADMPYTTALLHEKGSEKISAINIADIQQMVQIKERVETAAGSLKPKLFLASGNEPNGFSVGTVHGPIIAVSVGMVNMIDKDEDAMAALIGHELAHLYLDHGLKQQEREDYRTAASVALSFALGMVGVPAAFELTNAATSTFTKQFSRDEEHEADQAGVEYMVKAGFDPFGSVRLQEKLGAASGRNLLPFVSTHPTNSERIAKMKRLAMKLKPGQAALPSKKESTSEINK